MERLKETPTFKINGFVALMLVIAVAIFGGWQMWSTIQGLIGVLGRSLQLGDFSDLAALGAKLRELR